MQKKNDETFKKKKKELFWKNQKKYLLIYFTRERKHALWMQTNSWRQSFKNSVLPLFITKSNKIKMLYVKCYVYNMHSWSLNLWAVCPIQTDLQRMNSIIYPEINKSEMSAWWRGGKSWVYIGYKSLIILWKKNFFKLYFKCNEYSEAYVLQVNITFLCHASPIFKNRLKTHLFHLYLTL